MGSAIGQVDKRKATYAGSLQVTRHHTESPASQTTQQSHLTYQSLSSSRNSAKGSRRHLSRHASQST